MSPQDLTIDESILPHSLERIIRTLQPKHVIVGADVVLVAIAIHIHQTRVDTTGPQFPAAGSQPELVNHLPIVVRPRKQPHAAIERGDQIHLSVAIKISGIRVIDHAHRPVCRLNHVFLPGSFGGLRKNSEQHEAGKDAGTCLGCLHLV